MIPFTGPPLSTNSNEIVFLKNTIDSKLEYLSLYSS